MTHETSSGPPQGEPGTILDPEVAEIIDRAKRSGEPWITIDLEDFNKLVAKGGGHINGIRNIVQKDGKFKTQCSIEHAGEKLFFVVYTDQSQNWESHEGA